MYQGLKPDEIGYLKISNFKQDGCCRSKTVGTIKLLWHKPHCRILKPLLP
jgi:hypothetical protein